MHFPMRYTRAIVVATLVLPGSFPQPARCAWQAHSIRQGDGKGGWNALPAQRQVLRHPDAQFTMPFGLAQMDNGEIALLCSREKQPATGTRIFEPVIAFSKNGGATWSPFTAIPGTKGRPQFLTWLGGGRLSFITEVFDKSGKPQRIFSNDYGRTWKEVVDHPKTKDGQAFGVEGNAWVDFDDRGKVKAILELGWHYAPGKKHPKDDATVVFRRSIDDGKTWIDEVAPSQWKFTVVHKGKAWPRGVSEGAIVRAANGDLVAALRTDMPPKYFDGPNDDSLEGTGISISQDDGKTWSPLQFLYLAGRHHANLQRMPNGDLVCTLIVRCDIQEGRIKDGQLTSRRRGCDALISKDHGRTWNLDRRYELDAFDFLRPDGYWVDGVCGHIGAVVPKDGQVLAVYGNYPVGAVLIKWQPAVDPERATFYIAPHGSDQNNGSFAAPFQSLERARDAVRAWRGQHPREPATVLVRGGVYRLEQAVVFSGQDSGTAAAPIAYRAYPGETPVFSGGKIVSGWKPFRDKLLVARLPHVENQYYRFRELFLDGQRQTRARYPNFDQANPHFGGWAFIDATLPEGDQAVPDQILSAVFPKLTLYGFRRLEGRIA